MKKYTKKDLQKLTDGLRWMEGTTAKEMIEEHLELHPKATEEEAIQFIYADLLKLAAKSDNCY